MSASGHTADTQQVLVKRIGYEAERIHSYELIAPTGSELAPFTAGSHIDLHLPNGMIRSYSLLNDQRERHRYVIAVNRDAESRGGSSFVHDTVRVGEIMTISLPRNNFALCEEAEHSVLIAGGIGITPLLSMIRRLEALGRPWDLYYAARTRAAAAFLDELGAFRSDASLHVDFDDADVYKRQMPACTSISTTRGRDGCSISRPSSGAHRLTRISIVAGRCPCSRHSRR